ncbi:MAG: ribosome silencing factor [Planctomycetota bacterium]|jgi:ribosome-associated protein|nr:MAG: ribosome silencing factor [Planctomycetota bacterium]RLS99818.1 MAG: ribosome silencing factor [Planctomycetota bacterium]
MRSRSTSDPEAIREFAIEIARTLSESKCSDVILLDVRGRSQVCDYVVIASGTSQRQMRSSAQEIEDIGKARDQHPYRTNSDESTTWVVVDFVDIVTHLFEPDQRLYYDLELLHADGKRVDWSRPEGSRPAPRAPRAAATDSDA